MPKAQHTRSRVPSTFTATGMSEPLTFSKSRAGPPESKRRLAISATSKSGSTGTLIRRNCPRSSSWVKNARRSFAIVKKYEVSPFHYGLSGHVGLELGIGRRDRFGISGVNPRGETYFSKSH
jgi:hypothetical protein